MYIIMAYQTKRKYKKGGYMYSKSRSASTRDVNKTRTVQNKSIRARSNRAANRPVRKG